MRSNGYANEATWRFFNNKQVTYAYIVCSRQTNQFIWNYMEEISFEITFAASPCATLAVWRMCSPIKKRCEIYYISDYGSVRCGLN